jgi:uncharacterized protein (DUF1015 family)
MRRFDTMPMCPDVFSAGKTDAQRTAPGCLVRGGVYPHLSRVSTGQCTETHYFNDFLQHCRMRGNRRPTVTAGRSGAAFYRGDRFHMADVFPFAAVMPPAEAAPLVASPPYDVVNAEEAAALAADNPLAFLRVGRAEIELPADTDPYAPEVYKKAKANYERLKREAPLTPDSAPAYYVYSLVMNGHRQTGIVATPAVDDYDSDIIKKHEKTRQAKEDDRTRHILTLRSQTGPVFLTYRDSDAIDAIVATTMDTAPLFDFTADDGIRHTGWRVPEAAAQALRDAFAAVPCLYIADGHHRAASASRTRATLREQNPTHTGDEEYNRFLAVIFPASQLRILPYNRVVADLNGRSAEDFLSALEDVLHIEPAPQPEPPESGMVGMYLGGAWYLLTFPEMAGDVPAVERLDVSRLQNTVLAPMLGIDDPRTSSRIDFVGGIRGSAELERLVDQGKGKVAFAMFPTTVDELMAISDAQDIMPPKSTWFEPKLRDGLFCHDI